MNDIPITAQNLSTPYKAVAIYYEGPDILEYVREDVPTVHRRIDELLTLIFDMKDREKLIGFALKGFKSACLLDEVAQRNEFVSLVGILERAVTNAGHNVVEAYNKAKKIALEDGVMVEDVPRIAVG